MGCMPQAMGRPQGGEGAVTLDSANGGTGARMDQRGAMGGSGGGKLPVDGPDGGR